MASDTSLPPSAGDERSLADGEGARPPIALPAGVSLRDEYQVGRVIGAGGFGITYRAHDGHLDTPVAIKEYFPRHLAGRDKDGITVRPDSNADRETFQHGLQRFMDEGRLLARFDHPNIVRVRSYFESHGTGYLVMDYYEGRTLSERLAAEGGTLPESAALNIIESVTEGLHTVHQEGILHRDVDPQNIYLPVDGPDAILIDFGAAREAIGEFSQSLSVVLKPGYAPYEQYHDGDAQGPWTDVYACAATLYCCLTGIRPVEATRRLENDELVSPREAGANVSLDTSLAVMKGLAVQPDQRPSSAREFLALLRGGEGDTEPTEVRVSPEESVPDERTWNMESTGPNGLDPDAGEDRQNGLLTSSRAAFAMAAAALLGILVGPAEGVSISFFSYLGTWALVSLGLVGLFREAEHAMTPESRGAVRDWLLQRGVAPRRPNWPTTFIALFDAIFTDEHFSWTCFQRSALISVSMIIILLAAVVGLGSVPADVVRGPIWESQTYIPYRLLSFLVFAAGINVIVDYLSLLETRAVLSWMSTSDRTAAHLGYIGLDFLLTGLIFVGFLFLAQPVLYPLYQPPTAPPLFTIDGAMRVIASMKDALTAIVRASIYADRPPVVMVYSTLFTSVWIWLYAGTGLLLRFVYPVLQGLDALKNHFDVEARPVHSMGLLLAVVVSGIFAVLSPFVL